MMNLVQQEWELEDVIATLRILYGQHGTPLLSAVDLLLSVYMSRSVNSPSRREGLEIVLTLDVASRTIFECGKDHSHRFY